MSYCTSASRPSISLSVRRSVEPWPSEACGDKGLRETEPWPSTRGPGSAPHRQPGPATRSRPRARSGSARLCGPAARGGLRGGAAAGTGGGCAPAPQGAGRPVGTQRCGPVSRTGKQGAEVRTCGWTQATTSTDGSQGRGLGDKPWPPHHHLQPRFLHLWGGGLWSSPHRGRVCGRRAQSRTHSLDAKVGAPRPRDRLAQSARPRLGSLGARQLLRVREHGGERGQTLATERQRDPSGEQQPVPSRSQSAVHAPSCSLQVPSDGGGDAGSAQRSCEDPARGTRHPAEPAAEAGSGRDPAVGTPAADSLPRAGGGRGAGGGSRGGDGGGEPLGPRSAGSPPRNRAGLRVTAGAQGCRRLHLPPLPVG